MRKFKLTSLLLLSSLAYHQAHGTRLMKTSLSAKQQSSKVHEEMNNLRTSDVGSEEMGATANKENHDLETGTVKTRDSSRVAKQSHHSLPSIHEDYYGPQLHNPRLASFRKEVERLSLILSNGSNRKLMSKASITSSTTTISKKDKNDHEENKKAEPTVKAGQSSNETSLGGKEENFSVNSSSTSSKRPEETSAPDDYPDILDIAGMDYSPARRKPPIHN